MSKASATPVRAIHDIRWWNRGLGWRYCAAVHVYRKRDALCDRMAAVQALGLDFCREHGRQAIHHGILIVGDTAEGWLEQQSPLQ